MPDDASDRPIQIFVSYAWCDNETSPDLPDAEGFVTFLHKQLKFELQKRGAPIPVIWRDRERIGKHQEFVPYLQEAINASSYFVVVLSNNWLSSYYCRQELKAFVDRWKDNGGVQERIFIVRKRHVRIEDYRSVLGDYVSFLKDREGFKFYDLDDPDNNMGMEVEYFDEGKIKNRRYKRLVYELGGFLWRAAARMKAKVDPPSAPLRRPLRSNGRTVFVAKPASDMRAEYDRVVQELVQDGYTVVPDPERPAMPYTDRAVEFLDQKLAEAEVSIHLLGAEPGYVPLGAEPNAEPQPSIVKLQLNRAAMRLNGHPGGSKAPGFRRFIWVPENLPADANRRAACTGRNPLTVVNQLDQFCDGDQVVGGTISQFVTFVIYELDEQARHVPAPAATSLPPAQPTLPAVEAYSIGVNGSSGKPRVYIFHHTEDRAFARSVAKSLTKSASIRLPSVEGEDSQRNWLHRQDLAACDKVVLCWGLASDTWARASAYELKNWQELGRDRQFELRALVVGPPEREAKTDIVELQQPDGIDVIVDQMKSESSTDLEKLLSLHA
jgi:uncharacterized protein Usg